MVSLYSLILICSIDLLSDWGPFFLCIVVYLVTYMTLNYQITMTFSCTSYEKNIY